jgi:xanthine dehydrogenase accessory factor
MKAPAPPITPTPAPIETILETAAGAVRRGVRGAMATILARHGSAPGTPGQKLYVGADGVCVGTVGGGAIEREVLKMLVVLAERGGGAQVKTFSLGAELGMCCGGRLTVVMEPLSALVPCLVVGGGHVACALVPLLVSLGFSVTVTDSREEWATDARFPGARVVLGDHDEVGTDVGTAGVLLVMTHDHSLDQQVIAWGLEKRFAFVGGVGSRAKATRTRQRLEARGVPAEDIARVRMPLGLDIGARSPAEIAVSIAAELIAWRHRQNPTPRDAETGESEQKAATTLAP